MLSFVQLDKPHIDIELYGTDTNIAPTDKVHIMDEDSFEQFTLEWLFGCKKSKYSSIKRIGGAGDKGQDVVGYYSDTLTDSQQFDVLKEEIYNGIIDTHEQEYDSGYKRLVEDLKQAEINYKDDFTKEKNNGRYGFLLDVAD